MPPLLRCGALVSTGLFLSAILLPAMDSRGEGSKDSKLLSTVAEVRNLSTEEAASSIPVQLHGVVTYSEQTDFHAVFLQDGTGGIYVENVRDPDIRQGQNIEIDGVTAAGGFAPIGVARSWHTTGPGTLPVPRSVTAGEMQGGQFDGQWLEVRGIVQSVTPHTAGRYYVEIAMDRDSLRIILSDYPSAEIPTLVDSRVRVTGVCFTKRNLNRQWLANYLGVSGAEHFIQEESAPDLGSLPIQPIARLFRFPPLGRDGHRLKVQGVVLCAQPGGMTFVQDATQAIQIQTSDSSTVRAGDRVEALGFPIPGGFYPVMEEARIRVLGHETVPPPQHATIPELQAGRYGAELVEVEAHLVDSVQRPGELVFILQEAGQLFVARMPGTTRPATLPPVGSMLRLSGVCLLPALSNWQHAAPIRPASFELLLRDLADLVVVRQPSWWTVQRVAMVLAVVSGVLLAAMIWVAMLRRRVIAQTKLIENKIQEEATLEERTRIARELHDTLAQGFVGIAFQLEAVATHLGNAAHKAREHLDLALTMVRHSLAEARRSVMNLRAQSLETNDLAGALVETTRSLLGNSQVLFELFTEGKPRRLPPMLENNTLRIGQEAITNAVKYSLADRIQIHLRYTDESVTLRVEDTGNGFDTSALRQDDGAHFGLRGMRERAREMDAEFTLDSQPGRGTTITVTIPVGLRSADREKFAEPILP